MTRWCKDIDRDEAVRAAEDGRDAPLPTLGECIEAVTKTMSEKARGEEMKQGMRTERITLEVTQFNNSGYKPASEWDWEFFLRGQALTHGESVRVVEEAHFDDLAQVAMERDAAIGEREELRRSFLRSEESGTRLVAERDASRDDADKLRARVAELRAKLAPHANAVGGSNHAAPPQPRGWLTEKERALVQSWERHYTLGAHYAQSPSRTNDIAAEMGKLAEVCRSLLARSSPPEVVLPTVFSRSNLGDRLLVEQQVRQALAAAGVAVKEVGN